MGTIDGGSDRGEGRAGDRPSNRRIVHRGARPGGDSGFHHDEDPYRVVGVLRETGSVLDRLILVNSESVWEVHAVHGASPPTGETEGDSLEHGLRPATARSR